MTRLSVLVVALLACAHEPPKKAVLRQPEVRRDGVANLAPVYVFGRAGQKPPRE
jgi:hypothetical protein